MTWRKEEIGRIIKESRLMAGLTQQQVAQALGRPQNTISAWEVGRAQPDANTLFELFEVLGRSVDEAFGFSYAPFEVTSLEKEHIKKYRSLDRYGQKAVDDLLETEYQRNIEKRQTGISEESGDIIQFSVTEYDDPMSAGTGQPAGYGYGHNLLLIKEPPPGTSYVAPIAGNSMEPTYHDGDRLFVQACYSINVGEVGVFLMDGQQWVKELGDGELISHNPEYDPRPMTEDIRCQGRVLGVCDSSYFEE